MMSSGLQRRLRWVLLVLLVSVALVLWLGKIWVLEHELVKERTQLISQINFCWYFWIWMASSS